MRHDDEWFRTSVGRLATRWDNRRSSEGGRRPAEPDALITLAERIGR